MSGSSWLGPLLHATREFTEVLKTADLTAPVPSCPGWTLADLGNHVREVHLWAVHAVAEGNPGGTSEPVSPQQLAEAYPRSAHRLVDVLEAAEDDAPVWTFGADRTVAFWWRRQTHETALHLYDALMSQRNPVPWVIEPWLAWDGVDEVATLFYPRQLRLGRSEPLTNRLVLTATDVDRTTSIGEGEPVELTGTAADLLLTLWKRTPATDAEVTTLLASASITP